MVNFQDYTEMQGQQNIKISEELTDSVFQVTEFGLGKCWNDLEGGGVVGPSSVIDTFPLPEPTVSVIDCKPLANKVERCIESTVVCHCWKRRFYGIYGRESEVKIRELKI